MIETSSSDSEVITNAEVFYLFALLISYKDGYRCVFDISDLVAEHTIHQEVTAERLRENSVPQEQIMQWIKEETRKIREEVRNKYRPE